MLKAAHLLPLRKKIKAYLHGALLPGLDACVRDQQHAPVFLAQVHRYELRLEAERCSARCVRAAKPARASTTC
jgi:hypothetical protein